jgi:hypothetical protein
MGYPLRCLLADRVVEITCRTTQGRFLLRPSSGANQLIKGILGRAQRYTGLPVVACVFLSNHYHLLVVPDSEKQLSDFMRFVNTNLSKQMGRLHNWTGGIFSRRYHGIATSYEEEAQVTRLRYLLEHGVKENLVARSEDWPGVQCVWELMRGETELHGVWHERTAVWKAKRRGKKLERKQRITREVLVLSPLPAWRDMAPQQRAEAVRELVADIERHYRIQRSRTGSKPLGEKKVRSQHPHDRPRVSKRSPAPMVHAATAEKRAAMKLSYRDFVAAYREAAQRMREGLEFTFPGGCFPPTGPYIPRAGPDEV